MQSVRFAVPKHHEFSVVDVDRVEHQPRSDDPVLRRQNLVVKRHVKEVARVRLLVDVDGATQRERGRRHARRCQDSFALVQIDVVTVATGHRVRLACKVEVRRVRR